MKYRKMGALPIEVSALGFGCMRLPSTDGKPISKNIDIPEAISMIRGAVDAGVNYLDTAYMYHGGESERVLGRALKDGYRSRTYIASKSPMTIVKNAADYNRILDEQLKKLDVDYIDFYLFHAVWDEAWETIKREDLIYQAERARDAGKIRYIGFSFHDKYKVFEDIINGYSWDMCQIQYNYMNTDYQAGEKGLKLAASKNIGVVVMEPLLGGKLANPPKEVIELLKSEGYTGTGAELALSWLWNQGEVSLLLSGMSTPGQVSQNLSYADKSNIDMLSEKELELIEKVKKIYEKRTSIPCTGCSYCTPCPNEVAIPRIFKLYSDAIMYDYFDESRRIYNNFIEEKSRADKCIGCKICEEKCPQHIKISGLMPDISKKLLFQHK